MKKLLLTTALVAFAGVAHSHDHIPTTTSIGHTEQFGNSTTHGTATAAGLDIQRDTTDPDSASAFSVDSGTSTTTANGTFNSTGLTNTNNTTSNGFFNHSGNHSSRSTDYQETTDADTGISSYTYEETDTVTHSGGFSTRYEGDSGSWDDDGWIGGEPVTTVSRLRVNADGTTVEGGLNADTLDVTGNTTLGTAIDDGGVDVGISTTTVNGTLNILNGDGELTDVGDTLDNLDAEIGAVETNIRHIDSSSTLTHIDSNVTITGTLTVDGVNVADRLEQIRTTAATAGKQGEQGIQGSQGAQGIQGATGATGAAGRDGADGQDARININSAGQYVVSDSSGASVTVATDEQVTLTKDELTALIESVAATATANLIAESAELTAEIQAENEARIEAIQAEAEERITALTVAAEERLAIKTLAVSNTVSIVALEDQWKTDPVLGKFE